MPFTWDSSRAMKLISAYHSIDGIYEHINELKGKQKENLQNFEEQVRLSRKLATIIVDVPIEFNTKNLTRDEINKEVLTAVFDTLAA